ncbi:MAG: hypothetical protein COA70_05090 [Planctomycetota bacterium]|nr:MAG: hypothetical protein COA70_05090 [Planctomycetota bacterium]
MLFNSFEFLAFLPIALLGAKFLSGKARRIWLVILSYIFYGWATPWHCLLLVASTVLDFNIGRRMHATSDSVRRRRLLVASLCGNLGLLAAFKYSGMAAVAMNDLLAALGAGYEMAIPAILLPVGISFYTFQTLSYTIDVYRGNMKAEESFSTFALYVAFFPQLVAGPIERATHLLPQLKEKRRVSSQDQLSGWCRILWGLVKKVVFADWLAFYVDQIFALEGFGGPWAFLLAMNAFAFQIYLDFSAYSDIAIGLARLLGVNLRENFQWPYMSRSISDFWRRWHISLSTWLRDYLYIPLGGSRGGKAKTLRNFFIVMFLGGLWHGAAYTYILWGLWIGLALALHVLLKPFLSRGPLGAIPDPVMRVSGILLTYTIMLGAWVFFRAADLDQALAGFRVLGSDWGTVTFGPDPETSLRAGIALGVAVLAHILRGSGLAHPKIAHASAFRLSLFFGGSIILIALFHAPEGSRFLYFQF